MHIRTYKMPFFLASILFFSTLKADFSEFENSFNHGSGGEISQIRLVGERCSGTSYIYKLLKKNFTEYHVDAGGKHFLPWFDLPAFNIYKKPEGREVLDLPALFPPTTLLVVVVRDPYDWLRSFYDNPWHVSQDKMIKKGFFNFLQHEWIASTKEDYVEPDHWNPYENRRFANVLELRKYKTLNYLQVGISTENFVLARYETVAKDPEGFVSFLSKLYNIESKPEFENILTYKNSDKKYKKTEYKPFNLKELIFVNREIDWTTENLVGYHLIGNVRKVDER